MIPAFFSAFFPVRRFMIFSRSGPGAFILAAALAFYIVNDPGGGPAAMIPALALLSWQQLQRSGPALAAINIK